ncbi:hypothetical protein T552_01727 [Pneumocystis carinii B80]|uniref:S-adenosyl-L-methionine-dependent tRNA 4-demethylwyosine synthase n=1 Tax=Pneumocystis carinii (strain B80) TaxID=1408658 RepID=A0A0W4ZJB7_PNEC8|nr:hypothetical protein T552_01727 [Pneumocystis carinii B80]KTW28466.1 hypothetical protein T552_01727 [Pneumocystis carinii B80]
MFLLLFQLWKSYRVFIIICLILIYTLYFLGSYFQQGISLSNKKSSILSGSSKEDDVISSNEDKNDLNIKISKSVKIRTPKRFIRSLVERPKASNIDRNVRQSFVENNKQTIVDINDIYVSILYQTLLGSTEKYAKLLHDIISPHFEKQVLLENIDFIEDFDDYFVSPEDPESRIFIFLIPSYETDSPVDLLLSTLKDITYDFRVGAIPLRNLKGYAVLGFGDKNEWPGQKFCYQAKDVDQYMSKLGARRVVSVGYCDVKGDIINDIQTWADTLLNAIKNGTMPELVPDVSEESENEPFEDNEGSIVDMEDMGMLMKMNKTKPEELKPKEMVSKNSPTYKILVKQGYTIVGSHSGVKICRWTKSALRGRGSCYKYSFYGIKSHLCMETTPSLACANKCVFCWRGNTNPVGTSWRWEVDKPEDILSGIMEGHYNKIKQMKGIPGIRLERLEEAMRIRHCALSLVGEPITYPHINELVKMLHDRKISTFLVTNAQHPDALENIERVTQLYVSIDASTKDSLKKIDRPLFKDFWERFISCLEILSRKQQRTVYRLTLVKGFNTEEIEQYAHLVSIGKPCFIEVKGVTYCGNTHSSSLSMKNVPFHEEVVGFVKALAKKLSEMDNVPEYDIASEHVHSCCVLIAQKKFFINDKWYTHINYDRFFELVESNMPFSEMDYISETPHWAYFNSPCGGFSPDDIRWKRKNAKNVNFKKEETELQNNTEH